MYPKQQEKQKERKKRELSREKKESHSVSPQSRKTANKLKQTENKKLEQFNPLDIIAEHAQLIKEKESKLLEEQIEANGILSSEG